MAMQVECIRGNVLGCLNLADICNERSLHMTYFGTGCIFHYDDEFTVGSGKVRAGPSATIDCAHRAAANNLHHCAEHVWRRKAWVMRTRSHSSCPCLHH